MTQPSWATIEKTIQNAIAAASGLSVIWRHQNADAPKLDYLDLSLGAAATIGVDFINERYDNSQPAHSQMVQEVGGVRELPLQLQAWSSAVVEETAKATALSILDGVVTKLRLPTARNALAAVGFVPFDPGPTNWIPQVVKVGFRGRATCDVRCRMPARALAEYTDWIASLVVTAKIAGGPAGEIDLTVNATLP